MSQSYLRSGIFLAPFHNHDENPTLSMRARPRAARASRPAQLPRGLDRRASFGRVRADRLPGDVHRRRGAAHPAHPPRHRRRVAALPQPVHARRPHGAARPHDARPRDVRGRARRAGARRPEDRHRPGRPAPDDGRVVRCHRPADARRDRQTRRPTGSTSPTRSCSCAPTRSRRWSWRSPRRARRRAASLAGKYGVGMLSIGGTSPPARWSATPPIGASTRRPRAPTATSPNRKDWRVVGMFHIAETREQAMQERRSSASQRFRQLFPRCRDLPDHPGRCRRPGRTG